MRINWLESGGQRSPGAHKWLLNAHAVRLQVYLVWHLLCATPVSVLQVIKYGEPLDELQKDELRTAVEKLRRQMLRKSREFDCQILQERMELLHQAHQVRPRPYRGFYVCSYGCGFCAFCLTSLLDKGIWSVFFSVTICRGFGTLKTRRKSRGDRLKTWRKR